MYFRGPYSELNHREVLSVTDDKEGQIFCTITLVSGKYTTFFLESEYSYPAPTIIRANALSDSEINVKWDYYFKNEDLLGYEILYHPVHESSERFTHKRYDSIHLLY